MEELCLRRQGGLGADGSELLRYNVVIVGRFVNKDSWMSEAWKKEHPEGFEEEQDGPQKEYLERKNE